MRAQLFRLSLLGILSIIAASGQGTVPVFQHSLGAQTFTLAGGDPAKGPLPRDLTIPRPISEFWRAPDAKRKRKVGPAFTASSLRRKSEGLEFFPPAIGNSLSRRGVTGRV